MGERMDGGQIDQLRQLVSLAKRRGVALVAMQLPYFRDAADLLEAGEDYRKDEMMLRGADMRIWRDFESERTRALFDSMGIVFFDLARLPGYDNPPAFINAIHPGEALVLRSVIAALRDPRVRGLLPDIDIEALERTRQDAEAAGNYLDVFGSRF